MGIRSRHRTHPERQRIAIDKDLVSIVRWSPARPSPPGPGNLRKIRPAPETFPMPATVKVAEAKARLSELLAKVEAGEEFVIARGHEPIARLVPRAAPRRPRRFRRDDRRPR